MSLRVLTIVWDRYPEGGSKLLAMLALADWAGDDGGRCYPSIATLAAKIRMSERQAARLIASLVGDNKPESDNFLEHLNAENKGGRRKSNRYRIRLETLTKCHSLHAETMTNETLNPDKSALNYDIAMSYEPLEPLKEPLRGESSSYPQAELNWAPTENKSAALIGYIRQLESMTSTPPGELDRAREQLAVIRASQ